MATRETAVVAVAGDPITASIWADALRAAGIETRVFERGEGAALGGALTPGMAVFPVVVERGSLGAARSVIADLAGASALAPFPDRAAAQEGRRRALMVTFGIVLAVLAAGAIARVVTG